MADDAVENEGGRALRDVKAELDERRVARGVAIGLPVVTGSASLVAGLVFGPSMAILVLAGGMLLGVIALFWASLRVLSGDAPLSPELEALDATAHAVDALASRKRMLVRALKDLDNERALGKLEEEDHEQLSSTYRGELKDVMRRIDASLEPHRPKAEDAARAYLLKHGGKPVAATEELAEVSARGTPPVESAPVVDDGDDDDDDGDGESAARERARVTCSRCSTSNELDAAFCKKCGNKCGASLAKDAEGSLALSAKEDVDEA